MKSLIVTEAVINLLRQAKELTKICDSNGNVIGFFAPVTTAEELPRQNGTSQGASGIPEKCYTTKQVFERLLALTPDEKMQGYLHQKIQLLAKRDG